MSSTSGLDQGAVDRLLERVRREVDEGLLPAVQVALGFGGEIVVEECFGQADLNSRFCLFSATKPFVAATLWTLMAEGTVDITAPVVAYIPEFAGEDKAQITVEQVLLHTSGFPHAPLGPPRWSDRASRVQRMSEWRLNWQPGTRFEYHPTSAHWVLAEIIERVTGADYRDEIARRVTGPAGLPRIVGFAEADQGGIVDLVLVGEPATADELEAVFGVRELPGSEVTDDLVLRFNQPDVRAVGVPGGGGFGRARDLALFYQEFLHNPHGIWDPDVLAEVTGTVRNSLPDPMGVPANRSLGLVLAGDDGRSHLRGMGRTVSAAAFGHNGAGGQLAWADPATGLSLGYVTNGYDRHQIREPRRSSAVASLAAACVLPG
ncbi:MAG: serine hydrolase [Actinomycetota bacterium]|nr:serine hydrolase [Actinomycetota bacterium]